MNLNNIIFETGFETRIKYDYKPIILSDEPSIDGTTRHIDHLFIDGELQFVEEFILDIVILSKNDETALDGINGSNSVSFQPNDKTSLYDCNCSITFGYYYDRGQQIKTARVKLVVKDETPLVLPITMGIITNEYNSYPKNPDADGTMGLITNQVV